MQKPFLDFTKIKKNNNFTVYDNGRFTLWNANTRIQKPFLDSTKKNNNFTIYDHGSSLHGMPILACKTKKKTILRYMIMEGSLYGMPTLACKNLS